MVLGLFTPSLLLITIVVFIPVGWLFWLSLFGNAGQLSWENYARMIDRSSYVKTFETTFVVSFAVTFVCVILGYPLAYMLSQLPGRAVNICLLFVIMPFWTSVLVRTYAWLVLLQRNGLINTWLTDLGVISEPLQFAHNFTGVVIAMSHIMLPYLVLPLYASMKTIDRDLLRAAMNLGASPLASFRQVFFPLSVPGLTAGIILVFVLCLGFFVTPALMGGGRVIMWAMRIESTVRLFANWGAASALGVALLLVTLGCLYCIYKLLGSRRLMAGGLR